MLCILPPSNLHTLLQPEEKWLNQPQTPTPTRSAASPTLQALSFLLLLFACMLFEAQQSGISAFADYVHICIVSSCMMFPAS